MIISPDVIFDEKGSWIRDEEKIDKQVILLVNKKIKKLIMLMINKPAWFLSQGTSSSLSSNRNIKHECWWESQKKKI